MKSVAVLVAAVLVAPHAAAQECAPYKKIVEAAAKAFAPIRGASAGEKGFDKAPYDGMFETLVWLPRMASCRIIQTPTLASYACTNVMGVESAMRSAYDGSLADAKACLKSWTKSEWTPTGPPPSDMTPIDDFALKGPDGAGYHLSLEKQAYQGRTFWRVMIMFSVPRKADAGA